MASSNLNNSGNSSPLRALCQLRLGSQLPLYAIQQRRLQASWSAPLESWFHTKAQRKTQRHKEDSLSAFVPLCKTTLTLPDTHGPPARVRVPARGPSAAPAAVRRRPPATPSPKSTTANQTAYSASQSAPRDSPHLQSPCTPVATPIQYFPSPPPPHATQSPRSSAESFPPQPPAATF